LKKKRTISDWIKNFNGFLMYLRPKKYFNWNKVENKISLTQNIKTLTQKQKKMVK